MTIASYNDQRRAEHLAKIGAREANRLTETDRTAIVAALVTYLGAAATPTESGTLAVAARLAHQSIGCTHHDLRESELAEVRRIAHAIAIEAARTT